MSFFAALFGAFVAEDTAEVVGGVKSRLKRSFWVDGGGAAGVDGADVTGFEVVKGVNVSADRSVRCVRRAGAAVLIGGAVTTGGAGTAGAGASAGAGAASCEND
jgi:hypothetical protein